MSRDIREEQGGGPLGFRTHTDKAGFFSASLLFLLSLELWSLPRGGSVRAASARATLAFDWREQKRNSVPTLAFRNPSVRSGEFPETKSGEERRKKVGRLRTMCSLSQRDNKKSRRKIVQHQ
mmetsp:Transcript_3068/g.6256  ORF Transcript_3068/g.6256 Transcript_3068/m.6256 type:complete len:122 (-) Transcript_3068:84-449(-)